MNETQPLQTDIFGETHSLEGVPSLEPPKPRPVGGTQARLFEPQMEGQLTLDGEAGRILAVRESALGSLPAVNMAPEMRTAPEGAGRGATTTTKDR